MPALGLAAAIPLGAGWSATTVEGIGIFSGLRIRQDFAAAAFWERHCPIHQVQHGEGASGDVEAYTAAYNGCTGVSDVVYYRVGRHTARAGRKGDWTGDPVLAKKMQEAGKSPSEYVGAVDYGSCGLFGLDRARQAPVGGYNAEEDAAKMANTPTNLSPQNGYLSQRPWMWLDLEMRHKATDLEAGGDVVWGSDVELITGPLYALPEAFFKNSAGKKSWEDLLWRGGEVNRRKPWCKKKEDGGNFRSEPLESPGGESRDEKVSCLVGRSWRAAERASEGLERLQLRYHRSVTAFPLRIPLGFFKLIVVYDLTTHHRQTCPYILDQTGQCALVSLKLLLELSHIDLEGTSFAARGGTRLQPDVSDHEYSANVDPHFCVRQGLALDEHKVCYAGSYDAAEITVEMMDSYWDELRAAKSGR